MKKFTWLFALLGFLFISSNVFSQDSTGVNFSFNTQRLNDSEVVISIRGKINPGIKLFALQKSPEDVLYSGIQFDSSEKKLLRGSIISKGSEQNAIDPSLHSAVYFYKDSAEWQQKIAASLTDSFLVKGKVSYMVQKGDDYLPGEKEFKIFVLPEKNNTSTLKEANTGGSVATKSLWWIFIAGFAGGLLALITPCVFSMIPVTVSFFIKRSKTKTEGIKNAINYAASIIIIFTLLGFLITVIFGPTALNNLATNWIANLIFFLVFLIFG
ncbi:MAG TPA: protein-disulfide reductase, partial [Hanamia sp.]|nr:protein-disulfide reductase [Hanamia sp.]